MIQSELTCSSTEQGLIGVINRLIELSKKSGGECGRTLTEDETRMVEEADRDHKIIITSGRQHHIPTPLSTTCLIVKEYRFVENRYPPFVFSATYEEYTDKKTSRLVRTGPGAVYVKQEGI